MVIWSHIEIDDIENDTLNLGITYNDVFFEIKGITFEDIRLFIIDVEDEVQTMKDVHSELKIVYNTSKQTIPKEE